MADRTTNTHSKTLPIAATAALADLGLSEAGTSPDPAVAAYHRLRAAVAARPSDPGVIATAEAALIATHASSPAGVGAKLVELATHEDWFDEPDYYQTLLIHSALADLSAMGGAS